MVQYDKSQALEVRRRVASDTLPLRLRVALEDTDAGHSILQKWPLPEPRQHG